MRSFNLLALAASLSTTSAVFQGFNYGATKSDGYAPRLQTDFETLFKQAKNLVGASGFTSARLYTTIQAGTASDITSAIPAAIAQDTSLLLGLWASAGQGPFNNELTALKNAITQYGTAFTSRVAGISVGSEDLYRVSPTGIAAKSGLGADPATLASYIGQLRQALAGTALSSSPIGHVDTWTAWVNGSNKAVVDAVDWLGMDAYPYFQDTQSNGINNGAQLFNDAVGVTAAAGSGKPVWITETGWPVTGSTRNFAVANADNAKTYWQQVGCPLFGVTNTWWFTIEDTDNGASPNPSFGIASSDGTPLFDLSCSNIPKPSSAATSGSASATATGSGASSAISSASNAAPTLVSSGGGLSPTVGNGIGANGTAVATGSGAGSTPSGTASVRPSGSGAASGTSTGPASVQTTNAAAINTGSFVGVVGALFAAVAAL